MDLKAVIVDASRALWYLDAERLEEMAVSCEALVADRRSSTGSPYDRGEPENGNRANEMAIFMRVLEATRANLNVMRRLREVRMSQLEYGPPGSALASVRGS